MPDLLVLLIVAVALLLAICLIFIGFRDYESHSERKASDPVKWSRHKRNTSIDEIVEVPAGENFQPPVVDVTRVSLADADEELDSEKPVAALDSSGETQTVEVQSHDIATTFRGSFSTYEIGTPGRAAEVVRSRPAISLQSVCDSQLEGFDVGDSTSEPRLVVRAASTRGLSHRYGGDVRQDSFAVRITRDQKFLVIAVADGVSAGKHSHLAASIVTDQVPRKVASILQSRLPSDIDWRQVIDETAVEEMREWSRRRAERGLLSDLAKANGISDSEVVEWSANPAVIGLEMATTFAIAVVCVDPEESGNHRAWFVRLGDTSGWLVTPNDDADPQWSSIGEVKNEGAVIAESATMALPYLPQGELPVTELEIPRGSFLALVTDGIGDPLGSGTGITGRALATWWKSPPNIYQFGAQVDFSRNTFDDDRTAVVVWPIGVINGD